MIADPAVASAVQSKTVKLGMSPNEVKQSLGNPDKIEQSIARMPLGTRSILASPTLTIFSPATTMTPFTIGFASGAG